MVANLLVLLLIIGLAVLFGWLTWRAVRAQRLWVKILGGLGVGLLTLLLGFVSFLGGKGLIVMARVPAPVPDITIAGTPEQIARGRVPGQRGLPRLPRGQ